MTAFDPQLFAASAIDAETARFNAQIDAAEADAPARSELLLSLERTASPGAGLLPRGAPCPRALERLIPGPAGQIALRIIHPQTGSPRGIYLHFHGGGFCLGSARGQDPMLESISTTAGVVAISVEYRLAPEHPFPGGLADAEAAAWWVIRHGAEEFGTSRLILGGESAGANLSVATAIHLRDRRGFSGLAGLNLSQGGYDLRMTPSMRAGTRSRIVNTATLEVHLQRYLGTRSADHPEVSPLLADLRALAPALFTVGTCDPLLDDSMFMYCRWLAAGNVAELAIYPGGVHGFTFLPIDIGRTASQRIERFIAQSCVKAS